MSTDLDRQLRETLRERQERLHPSPTPPAGLLRRARRRAVRTVVLGVVSAAVIVAGSVGGIQLLIDRESDRTLGGEGDQIVLPTAGPVPGETSLLLASGEHDGERWTLRVTNGPGYGLGLSWG